MLHSPLTLRIDTWLEDRQQFRILGVYDPKIIIHKIYLHESQTVYVKYIYTNSKKVII